jgi:hypothetical protein
VGDALFPAVARLNHSCCPNCYPHIHGPARTCKVRTLVPVSAGQQLTVSYVPGSLAK